MGPHATTGAGLDHGNHSSSVPGGAPDVSRGLRAPPRPGGRRWPARRSGRWPRRARPDRGIPGTCGPPGRTPARTGRGAPRAAEAGVPRENGSPAGPPRLSPLVCSRGGGPPDFLDVDQRTKLFHERQQRLGGPTVRNMTSALAWGEITFGATPPFDQADAVVGRPRSGSSGSSIVAQLHERVDQLVDRRIAELGRRGVGGAARRAQPHAQDAARRDRRAGCRSARR